MNFNPTVIWEMTNLVREFKKETSVYVEIDSPSVVYNQLS